MNDTTSVSLDSQPSGNDMLDGFIYAILILVVLSTVTEKFVQLVRHYPKHFRIIGLALSVVFLYMICISKLAFEEVVALVAFDIVIAIVFVIQALKDKTPENRSGFVRALAIFDNIEKNKPGVTEEEKEKEVTALSFLIGFVVAYAFNAPMFKFFEFPVKIGWGKVVPFVPSDDWRLYILNPEYFGLDLGAGVGFILTGFFLTFGSKFFHELLETLYAVRNLKQTLNKEAQVVSDAETAVMMKAVNDIKQKLINIDGIVEVSLDSSSTPPRVVVGINNSFDQSKALVPTYVFYSFQQLPKRIPISFQKLDDHSIHGQNQPGDEIANSEPYPENAGSLGFVVTALSGGRKYILTCYHVVKALGHAWEKFEPIGKEDILHPIGGQIVGKLWKGVRDSRFDVALVDPISSTVLSEEIPEVGRPVLTRTLNDNDRKYRTEVRMYGRTSQFQRGHVVDLDVPAEFLYYLFNSTQKKSPHRIFKLIKIEGKTGRFSRGGDSGSIIVDEYNYAIGVLVGGNGAYSYAIPIEPLLEKLEVTI